MNNKKKNISIGRKVISMLVILEAMLLLICGLNMSSLKRIGEYNTDIIQQIAACEEVVASGDMSGLSEMEEELEDLESHITTRINGTYIFDVILVLLIMIVMGVMFSVARRTIAMPAKRANRQLQEILDDIVADQGDLTKRIQVRSRDEIGQLAEGINGFIGELQQLMQKLQAEANTMESGIGTTTRVVENSNNNVLSVSALMEELAASIEEISATMDQIATASNTNVESVNEISHTATEGANMVVNIKDRAKTMHQETTESKQAATHVIRDIGAALQSAVGESQSVKKIDELTGNILKIASQTNLLALNASIEAARAGEAGRGFSVVANEIRQLADSSRDTANDIQNISVLVMRAVESLSGNAQDMLQFVGEDVMKHYRAFEEIVTQYEADADTMDFIFRELSKKVTHMTETMERMNQGISDVSNAMEDGAAGIGQVAEDTSSLADSIAHVMEGIEENKRISSQLKSEVGRFKKV